MAADARRIVFGTHVVPKEGEPSEEGIPTKYILLQQDTSGDTVAKTLGGKGTVGTSEMQADQGYDGWTSMFHQNAFWEDQDTDWGVSEDYWDGTALITNAGTGVQLSGAHAQSVNKTMAFVYIKNTGTTKCYVSCTPGGGSGYNIVIPGGGSVQFRGGAADIPNCDDIYVRTASGTTTIEYVLAKSEA